jgi:predicted transcriptional regulator
MMKLASALKKRSSSEIITAILEACNGGCRITKIMQNVALTHSQARSYLSELLQGGMVTLDADEATIYTTTPEGMRYLRSSKMLLELMAIS